MVSQPITVCLWSHVCFFFYSNFAAYIVYRRYKPCEFLWFVWTDCWGNKSYYIITSPANSTLFIPFVSRRSIIYFNEWSQTPTYSHARSSGCGRFDQRPGVIRFESNDVIWLRNHAYTWMLAQNIWCKQTMVSNTGGPLTFLVFAHFFFSDYPKARGEILVQIKPRFWKKFWGCQWQNNETSSG